MKQVIAVEVELVDKGERLGRATQLGDGDAAVERHDGGGRDGDQLVVEGEDLAPVRLRGRGGIAVHGADRGLKLVGPGPVAAQACPDEVGALATRSRSHRPRSWSASRTSEPSSPVRA